MKRIIFTIALLVFIVSNIKAQELKEIRVYKDGDVLYGNILTSSDSIKFSESGSSRWLHYIQDGNEVEKMDISEIDSIIFCNYVDTFLEDFEILLNVHELANEKLKSLNNENPTPELAQWLATLPEVSSVNYENNSIHIEHNSGLESCILILKGEAKQPNLRLSENFSHSENENTRSFTSNDDPNILTNKKVLLWAPFFLHETNTLFEVLNNSELNFSIRYIPDNQCTVTSLNNLTDYGIVVLNTHGKVGGNTFVTGQKMPNNPHDWTSNERYNFMNKNYELCEIYENGIPINYFGLTSKYIRSLSGNFEKSVIFNSSCHSAGSDSLSDAFFSKGAKTYLGYSNTVCTGTSLEKIIEFFYGLTGPELKKTGEAYIPDYDFQQCCMLPCWYCSYILKGSTEMHFENCVMINGVCWATRNLDVGGQFVAKPEDYGALFQWGRRADGHEQPTSGTTTTLSNTDTPSHGNFILVSGDPWDWRSPQNDNLWGIPKTANDPCPAGWRVPTHAELQSLANAGGYWGKLNGVNGQFFGSGETPLFLPAAGSRIANNGSLDGPGAYGWYWSSSALGVFSYNLYFTSIMVFPGGNAARAYGYSVRCVAEH